MLTVTRIWFAMLLMVVSLSPAFADVPAISAYLEASSKFDQMVATATAKTPPRMPRITTPAVATVIATLSDAERFLVKPQFGVEDQGTLLDICDRANKAVMVYMLFDLKNHVDTSAGPLTNANSMVAVMNRNIHTFQAELSHLQPFVVRCNAKGIPLMAEFQSRLKPEEMTDVRRAGLQRARMGGFATVLGSVQAVSDGSLNESYRIALLHAVAENARQFASFLPVASRQQIVAFTLAAQRTAPAGALTDLSIILESMSSTECAQICSE